MAFAPQHTKVDLVDLGMPDDMQHTNSGTRILGAPVGREFFWVEYASSIVSEIGRDFMVLGRMSRLCTASTTYFAMLRVARVFLT